MLHRPLLEVEESFIHAHQARADVRLSPRTQAVAVSDGGATDHKGGFGAPDVPEQADLHGQFVPGEVEEHEMPPVVDLWVQIGVAKARPEGERMLCKRLYRSLLAQSVTQQKTHDAVIGVHPRSRLSGEGLDSGDVPAEDEVVDVVGAFVGLDRFEVGHVAHDRIFVKHAVRSVDVARDAGDVQGDVDVVHLRQADLLVEP